MEALFIILLLVIVAILVAAVILPIVALVVSIRTSRELNRLTSSKGQPPLAGGQSPQLPIAEANRLAAWVQHSPPR